MEAADTSVPSGKPSKGVWMLMACAVAVLASVIALAAHQGLLATYEDCLTEGMRGQVEAMFGNVERGCKMRFGQEVSLDINAIRISFSSSSMGSGVPKDVAAVLGPFPFVYGIKLDQVPEGINPTRGRFLFSHWPCGVSIRGDGPIEKTLTYQAPGEGFSVMEQGPPFQCVQAVELFGVYRPWWARWLNH
jgi:hypothetical protein